MKKLLSLASIYVACISGTLIAQSDTMDHQRLQSLSISWMLPRYSPYIEYATTMDTAVYRMEDGKVHFIYHRLWSGDGQDVLYTDYWIRKGYFINTQRIIADSSVCKLYDDEIYLDIEIFTDKKTSNWKFPNCQKSDNELSNITYTQPADTSLYDHKITRYWRMRYDKNCYSRLPLESKLNGTCLKKKNQTYTEFWILKGKTPYAYSRSGSSDNDMFHTNSFYTKLENYLSSVFYTLEEKGKIISYNKTQMLAYAAFHKIPLTEEDIQEITGSKRKNYVPQKK